MARGRQAEKVHVYLIGFSGSGKSTVGRLLARKMRLRFIDLDREIELKMKQSIPEIFDRYGEARFRSEETSVLRRVAGSPPAVIAVGGGGVVNPANRAIMFQTGTVIYLKCSLKVLNGRLRTTKNRPLLSTQASRSDVIRALFQRRKRYYELAELTVTVSSSAPVQIAARIAKMLATQ